LLANKVNRLNPSLAYAAKAYTLSFAFILFASTAS
jgi:hypothetical protein